MASFPLITGQVPTPGTPVTLALTLDADPDNPLVGDLHISNGQIHFWDATEARRQKIRMILLFFKGEYWLNREEGIPFFSDVIGSRRPEIVLSIYRQALQQGLPDLAQIASLNGVLDGETRAFAVDFQLVFTDGEIINSADFGPILIQV